MFTRACGLCSAGLVFHRFEAGEHLLRFDMLDEIDREFQRQIHRLLVHDELTGLLTGKSFFSELRREAARGGAVGTTRSGRRPRGC